MDQRHPTVDHDARLTLPCRHQLLKHVPHTIGAEDESDEIGNHHQEDVQYGAERTDMSIPRRMAILSEW